MRAGALPLVLALALACGVGGCASSTRVGTVQRRLSSLAAVKGGAPAHVAVLVLENQEYTDVIGSPAAPFLNHLARTGALATGMYAITHPSLPNYLALTGGSTFGIDSDCTDCSVHAAGLVQQLNRAGVSWKAYMEGLPRPCFTGATAGDYAKKHDPFVYYTRATADPASCRRIVPLAQLAVDERAGTLTRFLWITPNLCHDMHDCSVATGDRFMSRLVPPLLRALGSRGLLIVTWDEGTSDDGCCRLAAGGHVAAILAGGLARPHGRMSTPTDLYSILQTVEDLLGLPRLRAAACPCTPTLAPLLLTGAPPTRG